MKVWLTIEPNQEEIETLLSQEIEGVSKTPLIPLIQRIYGIMSLGHEVSLKVTNMKRQYE